MAWYICFTPQLGGLYQVEINRIFENPVGDWRFTDMLVYDDIRMPEKNQQQNFTFARCCKFYHNDNIWKEKVCGLWKWLNPKPLPLRRRGKQSVLTFASQGELQNYISILIQISTSISFEILNQIIIYVFISMDFWWIWREKAHNKRCWMFTCDRNNSNYNSIKIQISISSAILIKILIHVFILMDCWLFTCGRENSNVRRMHTAVKLNEVGANLN